jgi:hypothetical protein
MEGITRAIDRKKRYTILHCIDQAFSARWKKRRETANVTGYINVTYYLKKHYSP